MPKFPSLKPKEVCKEFRESWFRFVRQNGSHKIYIKDKICITLPWHNTDMRIGTVKSIIKQSGLTTQEFFRTDLI